MLCSDMKLFYIIVLNALQQDAKSRMMLLTIVVVVVVVVLDATFASIYTDVYSHVMKWHWCTSLA